MNEQLKDTETILREHTAWTYDRTDRNGTRYFYDHVCGRCGGTGRVPFLVDNGICYECGGSGRTDGTLVKIYTPEYEQKLMNQRQARAEKRRQTKLAEFTAHMDEHYAELGFAMEDGVMCAYRVVGNTYPIKDTLKELGFKYHPCMGWYTPHWSLCPELDGYTYQRILASDMVSFNEETISLVWIAPEQAKQLWSETINKPVSLSTWKGEVGDRIDLSVTIKSSFAMEGFRGGTNYLYLMEDADGNVYKWITAKVYECNKPYNFRATIKDHEEYKGVKQTVITRAVVVA